VEPRKESTLILTCFNGCEISKITLMGRIPAAVRECQ